MEIDKDVLAILTKSGISEAVDKFGIDNAIHVGDQVRSPYEYIYGDRIEGKCIDVHTNENGTSICTIEWENDNNIKVNAYTKDCYKLIVTVNGLAWVSSESKTNVYANKLCKESKDDLTELTFTDWVLKEEQVPCIGRDDANVYLQAIANEDPTYVLIAYPISNKWSVDYCRFIDGEYAYIITDFVSSVIPTGKEIQNYFEMSADLAVVKKVKDIPADVIKETNNENR